MPIHLLGDVRRIFAGHIEPGRLIVLECAAGAFNTEVAARLGISRPTVGKWRSRFIAHRLDGLVDDPRPGRSATVAAEQVEDVVVATLESTPPNATHWSQAKMAERTGLSKSTIGRIRKAFGLEPHRTDGFKPSDGGGTDLGGWQAPIGKAASSGYSSHHMCHRW